MTPQYQFNLGQADPLLSIAQNNPEGYISVIEQELQKLNNVKQQLIQAKQPTQQNINNAINIWDSINNEIASMTNDQKELLAKDETYISIERELQLMIQEELINSVKDKVAINAQYHDYVRLYSEWFRNINKNELDNKIIESAITFYFKDEDSGSTKTWNYFKTAN